jgi:hypothetical protein
MKTNVDTIFSPEIEISDDNSKIRLIIILTLLLLFTCSFSKAQKASKNNYTGTWESTNSWTNGVVPATANIGASLFPFNINGYITRTGNLSFANINADATGPNFTVNDTLVIHGNVTFENKAANLVLGPNSVMIVFGDFTATNKVTVENGGILIITEDMSFSSSSQDEYDNSGGGELYVGGDVTNNPDADSDNDWGNLDTEYPQLWNFVNCSGVCPLPIKLLDFNVSALDETIQLNWVTVSEENFEKFIIQRASDGETFQDLAEVPGAGKNLFDIKTYYSYKDTAPLLGFNYYRLKALDLDGTYEYFKIKAVKLEGPKRLTVYPNPSSGNNIHYITNFATDDDADRITIMDARGIELISAPVNSLSNSLDLESPLKPGVYILKYTSKDFEKVSRVVVKNN